MRRRSLCAFLLAGLLAGPAHAFIERLYSLKEVMDESNQIYVGRLTRVDATKRIAAAQIERALKGRKDFELVKMNLGIGPADHAAYLLGVLKEGDPVIIYAKRDGRDIASCVHAGDTWFQLFATAEPKPDDTWWRMTHVEIAMGRTFNGTTPDLIQITSDAVAGRAAPPKPNPSIPRIDVRRAAKPVQPPPPPASEPLDGLEGVPGWACEQTWARPATLTVEETRDRGKVLRARSDGAADKKLAITLLHHVDVSAQPLFAALVDNDSDRPIAVAVAFGCAPEWTMFEAPPVSVPAKARAAPVRFSVASPHFKCEASQWQHNQPIPNNGRVDKIMLLVDGLPAKGSVAFDRILGARGGFRLAGEFPHGGGEVRGISWADADGDDRLDALLCVGGANLLLLNQGGAFREQAAAFGLSAPARAAAWADYDGDGHPDLLTSHFRLFTAAGGRFRDDSRLLPAPHARNPEGAGWIDYNGDGLPDILITNGEHGICLFENTGKGPNWFRDASDKAGLGPKGLGVGNGDFIAFADYDGDGYTDFLYNLGDGVLAHNEGGKGFKLDTRAGIRIGASNEAKRGVAFADFDNDGDLDLFVPDPARPRLYRNNNDGTFTDVLAAAGDLAKLAEPCVSAAWGDVNNDGCLDLFVCLAKAPGRLFLGDGRGGFKDATAAAGLDQLPPALAASFADTDEDGDLDLVLNGEKKALVLLNDLELAPGCGSLAVSLAVATGSVGAVVRVADPQGRPLGLRELNGAEGLGGQAAPEAHFGLKAAKVHLSVCLTDGRVAQKTLEIAPGKALRLTLDATAFK
ncbi:MAG TPA: VCBS repeat-containing protein [Planctomycetota bacterium]|nr:VCBS repeat-containing protein [Planctomycetota bacterium]HRR82531.1 VCBS repeat-containing protein [Planctomycetota bacterium]HRT97559.1 VCBS repeat-containing protein [Planctomycetota bacterium]